MNTDFNKNDFSGRGRKDDPSNLTESRVRDIFREEMIKNSHSGTPIIAKHTHDGNNSSRIHQSDITNSVGIMGKIDFTSNTTYTLYFSTQNPSRLDINGFVFDNGATNSSVMFVGVALLSSSYYFQPLTTRSVKQGGSQYPIGGVLAQCSSNFFVQDKDSPSFVFPHTEQFFIFNCFTAPGTPVATGQLQNLTATSIDIVITNLLAGWKISANFIIT